MEWQTTHLNWSTLLFGAVLLLLIIINVRESRQERLRERARA